MTRHSHVPDRTSPGERWAEHAATRAVVARATSQARMKELAFVLLAVGVQHAVLEEQDTLALVVPARDALRATRELEQYAAENQPAGPGPAPQPLLPPLRPVLPGLVVFALVLTGFWLMQNSRAFQLDWTALGRTEAAAIRGGDWWRAVTALTLHSDVPHLVGNLLFGAAFFAWTCQLLGNGLGWLAIVLGGSLGNLINAFIQTGGHRSLGTSTAVFAALGLLSALSWRRSAGLFGRLRRNAPLVMGVALLGFVGTSGERTDVVAHVTGFLTGILFGAALAPWALRPHGRRTQLSCGAAAALLLAGSWILAVAAAP